ncbi:transcription elongation factor spt4 [Cyclospora cayetanensis]|uniref:Transcription elongation factor spt4 n=1 Tax=Cyclospora cayetanensis TaxID=88456 RepID=A0A1D3CRJ0_9EIME|nr:transcription elongation factor spt4 [Cyclospora cayetanensis]
MTPRGGCVQEGAPKLHGGPLESWIPGKRRASLRSLPVARRWKMDSEGRSGDEKDQKGPLEAGEREAGGVVPLGTIRKVKTREGEEKEKVQLKLRACISCRLFYDEGCPNCAWLQIDGDRSRVLGCTSPNFAGFVALIKPQGSWVARHNKLIKVLGDLPDSIKDDAHRFAAYGE